MLIQINLWIIKEENLCRLTPYWCYLLLTFSYPFFYPSLHLTNIPDPSTLHFGQSIFNTFVYGGWGVGVSSCLTRSATNDTNFWPMYLYDIVYFYKYMKYTCTRPKVPTMTSTEKKCWWKYRISFTHDSLCSVIQYILLLWKITSFTER